MQDERPRAWAMVYAAAILTVWPVQCRSHTVIYRQLSFLPTFSSISLQGIFKP